MRAKGLKSILKTAFAGAISAALLVGASMTAFAADARIESASTDSTSVYLYVSGVNNVTAGEFQIGNSVVSNVAMGSISAMSPSMQTVILVDNSQSISATYREQIKSILDNLIASRMEGEVYRLGTFSDSITWVNDAFTNDYDALVASVDSMEYQNQDTYFSDCLYSIISELNSANYSSYTRVIMISDGADDQAIGYSNNEVLNLLERSNIPVYTVGTPGNNSALETMFSFSRTSKADYFLLGGATVDDVVAGLNADHSIVCFKLTPDAALLDGSNKSIQAKITSDEGDNTFTTSVNMPFGSATPATTENADPVEEPETAEAEAGNEAEVETSEATTEENSSDSLTGALPSLGSLGGSSITTETVEEVEEAIGIIAWIQDNLMMVIAIGAGVLVLMGAGIAVPLILVNNKKKKEAQEKEKKAQEAKAKAAAAAAQNAAAAAAAPVQNKTVIMGAPTGGNGAGATMSLWGMGAAPAAPVLRTYIVLKDLDRPTNMFKLPIESSVRLGRMNADIVIDYDKFVSGSHCEIIKRGELLYLKDLGSSNGTFYGGIRVYDQETPIMSGGTITVGQTRLSVDIVKE